ncbi:hypothetical protein VD0002_g1349 [Verticillium dahliae]|uniref:2,5-diamino-6-ribosylamino-4(3H)-pyrimidinone 5'-phosphate reductase n=1 Tax=Verticillium dahliae TaxID=27337 RepID=A0AA45ANM6_VERDA|nr:bifunctional deaminase-reductase domain-containing protein [Verticillium dahliae]PNH33715.1 hypothetical protein BJF96_g3286 [Verticillium dahliae]PNH44734.1 hypothetical protein VD0003_g9369 [Verticillium dahliae]PNH68780.1 hypothetical protein VD0002_g1349 [Verticillium dahliae]
MPRVRYNVATTLDGFIASPDGSTTWILDDPSIDFTALYNEFSCLVMGRKTYEVMLHHGETSGANILAGHHVIVISKTLKQEDYPDIEIVRDGYIDMVRNLKSGQGKDIWLMGGSRLASEFLAAGLLDAVETAVMPAIIGRGIKMISQETENEDFWKLNLRSVEKKETGILMLTYDILYTHTSLLRLVA